MIIICADCGCEVNAQRSTRKLCDPCKTARNAERSRKQYVPTDKSRMCVECSAAYESKNGNGRFCPPCRKARAKAQIKAYAQRPEVRERRNAYSRGRGKKYVLAKYGLTEADWLEMVEKAGGKCEICGKDDEPLCVDHCHATSAVRGILCRRCNRSIGQLGDTLEDLRRVVAYLERTTHP